MVFLQCLAKGCTVRCPNAIVRNVEMRERLVLLQSRHARRNRQPAAETIKTQVETDQGLVRRKAAKEVSKNVLAAATTAVTAAATPPLTLNTTAGIVGVLRALRALWALWVLWVSSWAFSGASSGLFRLFVVLWVLVGVLGRGVRTFSVMMGGFGFLVLNRRGIFRVGFLGFRGRLCTGV